jgi:hypothetical protein
MAYYIERFPSRQWDCNTLHELNPNEVAACEVLSPTHTFERVGSRYAHWWVKRGFTHTTGLYVDGKRIRKAQPQK